MQNEKSKFTQQNALQTSYLEYFFSSCLRSSLLSLSPASYLSFFLSLQNPIEAYYVLHIGARSRE